MDAFFFIFFKKCLINFVKEYVEKKLERCAHA